MSFPQCGLQVIVMLVKTLIRSRSPPICTGSGLVALDVIFCEQNKNKPIFLAGGSCGNVLTILSYLGWHSYPIARLGHDVEGGRILEDVKKWKVRTRFVERDSQIDSPRVIEWITNGKNPQHRFLLKCSHGKWLPRRRPILKSSLKNILAKMPKSNVFYFDRVSSSTLIMARTQKERGALIMFEPPIFKNDKLFKECLAVADIVKHCYNQSIITENTGINIPLEIQTMGSQGLRYKAKILGQRSWQHMDSYPVHNLVDAAGSGDWLSAGIIHVLGQNGSMGKISERKLELALKFGQCLASINCHYVGARGIMYNMSKQKLFSLVKEVMESKETSDTIQKLPLRPIAIKSKLASKCRVCTC